LCTHQVDHESDDNNHFPSPRDQAEQHIRWKQEFEKKYEDMSSAADDLKQVKYPAGL
jgi:hypothetical protein